MKKVLLFGLSASLGFWTGASAQQPFSVRPQPLDRLQMPLPYILVRPTPTKVSAAVGLQEVTGKPGVFLLKSGSYEVKDVLEILAAKTGGEAVFVDGFKFTTLDLLVPLHGTAPELIEKMEDFGVAAGKIGKNWVFVPIKPKTSSLPLTYILPTPFKPEPRKFDYFGMPGVKPFDSNKVPLGAKPFEFNGERIYHVPLNPTQK